MKAKTLESTSRSVSLLLFNKKYEYGLRTRPASRSEEIAEGNNLRKLGDHHYYSCSFPHQNYAHHEFHISNEQLDGIFCQPCLCHHGQKCARGSYSLDEISQQTFVIQTSIFFDFCNSQKALNQYLKNITATFPDDNAVYKGITNTDALEWLANMYQPILRLASHLPLTPGGFPAEGLSRISIMTR